MQNDIVGVSYVYEVPKIEKFKSAFNRIIKFLWDIFFVVFVAIVLVAIIYGIYTKRNGNNGYVPIVSAYVIVSPSMVPTINVRDAVIAYRPNAETLKKGDIITFNSTDARYSGLTVTHRILNVTKSEDGQVAFETKGDNNTTPDGSLVLGSNIYGKVFFVVPWLGYLQVFLTTTYGWILLVVLPCFVIIISDMIKLVKTLLNSKVPSKMEFKNVEILEDDSLVIDNSEKLDVDVKVQDKNISSDDKISVVSLKSSEKDNNEQQIDEKINTTNLNDNLVVEVSNHLSIVTTDNDSLYSTRVNERKNIIIASNYSRSNTTVDKKIGNLSTSSIQKNKKSDIVVVDNINRSKNENSSTSNDITILEENSLNVIDNDDDQFIDIEFLECDIIDDEDNINESKKEEKEIDNSEIELL